MSLFIGWKWLPVDSYGYPCEYKTGWEGECFIVFGWVVYVGKIRQVKI